MGFKKFVMKQALRMKGVSSAQADIIAEKVSENPELAESLKKMEANPEIKALLKKIQDEIEAKKKAGMPEMYAAVQVMGKYKSQIAKYQTELAPLMGLLGK